MQTYTAAEIVALEVATGVQLAGSLVDSGNCFVPVVVKPGGSQLDIRVLIFLQQMLDSYGTIPLYEWSSESEASMTTPVSEKPAEQAEHPESKPVTGNGTPFSPRTALAALETIKNMGTEQEQREAAEYLQRVLHEYRNS